MDTHSTDMIDIVMERIRTLSGSCGTPPYTLLAFSVDGLCLPEAVLQQINGFKYMIGMYVWDDYHFNDMEDYLSHGTEYLKLDESGRQALLAKQRKASTLPGGMMEWKLKHLYIALGITAMTITHQGANFKLADEKLLSLILPSLPNRNNLILTELLLMEKFPS